MPEPAQTQIAFGPVGIAGWGVLLVGVLLRRRLVALIGLAGVVADVTVAELGGSSRPTSCSRRRTPSPSG